jgi:hypothetical protein
MKQIKMSLAGIMLCALIAINVSAAVAKPASGIVAIPASWRSVKPQERLKALRVAQIDAYRALAERVYGFQLESGSTIFNYMLQSDAVKAKMAALLKGATEMSKPEYTDYGMVMVTYGVKLRSVIDAIKTDKTANKTTTIYTLDKLDKVIEALGCGALPGSKGERMLHARRAAELDAYRLMAERFVGVKINSTTTVQDLCLGSDKVAASVAVFIKGLKPVAITYGDDNTCEVKMQLKVRETVKTIETLVKIFNDGTKKKITRTDITKQDRIFTVNGHGAPSSPVPRNLNRAPLYNIETTIIHKIIHRKIITD